MQLDVVVGLNVLGIWYTFINIGKYHPKHQDYRYAKTFEACL